MTLVAASVTLLAGYFGLRSRLISAEARRIHVVALSDAAVAESLARLSESSGFEGVSRRPFGGGAIASKIESLSENRQLIVATSFYRGWTRQTRVRVRLHSSSIEIESWETLPPGQPSTVDSRLP
jgi:hypothetical protein